MAPDPRICAIFWGLAHLAKKKKLLLRSKNYLKIEKNGPHITEIIIWLRVPLLKNPTLIVIILFESLQIDSSFNLLNTK